MESRCSASFKKLSSSWWWNRDSESDSEADGADDNADTGDDEDVVFVDGATTRGNCIADLEILKSILLTYAVCAICKTGKLLLRETRRQGLGSKVSLSCTSRKCPSSVQFDLTRKSRFYDVHRRSVLAARRIGRGHAGLKKFCTVMDLPRPVSKSNFHIHQVELEKAASVVAENSRNAAAQSLIKSEGSGDVAMTFDGTWQRRGFSSLNGVFTAISWTYGKVVDIHTSSKHCHQCVLKSAKLESRKMSPTIFSQWKDEHQQVCSANTTRSSPGMESEAAHLLWCRSLEKRKLWYTTYIGDGNCKGFNEVCTAKPYGDVPVVKEECVGHIQKRMGKALRDLKKAKKGEKLSDGLGIGGAGRLTDTTIDVLQMYYGLAIRANTTDLKAMAHNIWAGLWHRRSTDEVPKHDFCPSGRDSWCGFQQVKAGKKGTYVHHNSLPEAVYEAVLPVYQRLTDINLLRRCLMGATQNANEAFNGVVWRMCPKEVNSGHEVVKLASDLATISFNDGAVAFTEVLKEMGCHAGQNTVAGLQQEDKSRIIWSEAAVTPAGKKVRKKRRRRKKGWEEAKKGQEGVTYEAGAF